MIQILLTRWEQFRQDDLLELRSDAAAVVKQRIPDYEAEYKRRGWKMFPQIERVYVNKKARNELGWIPRHNFSDVLKRLKANDKPLSDLAYTIGAKGYHSTKFTDAPYSVEDGVL